MTAAVASPVDELLEDLAAAGVSLCVRGIKLVLTPPAALTPALIDRVRANKAALICFARLNGPCELCGSAEFEDFTVHGGRSVRRDCVCGHTRGFPVWYGAEL